MVGTPGVSSVVCRSSHFGNPLIASRVLKPCRASESLRKLTENRDTLTAALGVGVWLQ